MYPKVVTEKVESFCYVHINFVTIHIRAFSDGLFQKLSEKNFQSNVFSSLVNDNKYFNTFQWYNSSPASHSTLGEYAELLSLDVALLRLRNHATIMFSSRRRRLLLSYISTINYFRRFK